MEALCLSSYISLASNCVVDTPKFMHGGSLTRPNKSLQMVFRPRGKRVITSARVPPVATSGNQSNSVVEVHSDGIGIVKFLQGKSLLVTGCTGFLGKVLLEKILRTAPDVRKIFVLIKAKNKEDAMERLQNEIIYAELFERLKEIHGKSYQTFMLSKLDPMLGTLCESNLGLDEDAAALVAKEVDIIVNSAANTTFDERYDRAIEINTSGPTRLMGFAKLCRKLKVFVQVSSAYVNGKREGRIMEKHFCMGESILLNEKQPTLRVEDEILLILESKQAMHQDSLFLKKMKELGKERANTFGWQDVYTFTKAMGEMMLESSRGDIPLVIMRPSIIESTYREPIPGWIQGSRMMDPLIQHYGNGNLPGFLADPNVALDIIPADMAVNAMLAAMAKHGVGASGKSENNIYQVASSAVNPFLIGELFMSSYEHFNFSPLMDSAGSPIRPGPFAFFSSMEDLSRYLGRHVMTRSNGMLSTKLEIRLKKMVEQVKRVAKMYEHYTFYHGRFDISNTKKLMGFMSEEEKQLFAFDIESLDWEDYIKNVHIPGLRKYVMKEK